MDNETRKRITKARRSVDKTLREGGIPDLRESLIAGGTVQDYLLDSICSACFYADYKDQQIRAFRRALKDAAKMNPKYQKVLDKFSNIKEKP